MNDVAALIQNVSVFPKLIEKVAIALCALLPGRIVKLPQCSWLVRKKYLGVFGLLGSPTSEKFLVLNASLGQEPVISSCAKL